MSEVIFQNLRSGVAIKGNLAFMDGRFVADPTSSSNYLGTNPPTPYQNIEAIAVEINTEVKTEELQSILISAYRFVLMIISAMAAKYQSYLYLEIPVKCTFVGKTYILHEDSFREEEDFKRTLFIGGGDGFCDNLSFLNKNKNPRLVLHFYRTAKDETKPIDYRVLQLWRFFEGWFKIKDWDLVNKIVGLKNYEVIEGWNPNTNKQVVSSYKITRRFVRSFYLYYRSAIAHGGGSRPNQAKKVLYPLTLEFDSDIFIKLHFMEEIADYLLRKNPKIY